MSPTPLGLILRPIVPLVDVEQIASTAIAAANRPAWGNPLVIALELGFALLPRVPGSAPEWSETTTAQIVFAAEPSASAHADRVRLALARGLLLRSGFAHTPGDVQHLARRLRQIPE